MRSEGGPNKVPERSCAGSMRVPVGSVGRGWAFELKTPPAEAGLAEGTTCITEVSTPMGDGGCMG